MRSVTALVRVVFNIGGPIALFYVLRGQGVSDFAALAVSAAPPALGAGYTLVVQRRADTVAVFVVVSIVLALVTSAIVGNPRFLLAKDGIVTGSWGIWFLVSARGRHPAALVFARPLMEHVKLFGHRSWDDLWDSEPQFRRIWRVATVMWGIGLLADAAVRLAISYLLPIDVVPAIGGFLYPVTFVVLQVAGNIYFTRAGLYKLLGARWLQDHGGRRNPDQLPSA